ncbi:MAG: hypothetical protein D6820_02140, partial [Lentisphaerae bacterium]
PLIYDTGTGWQIQCQYLHQQADAVAHCAYIHNMHHDPTHRRFPFHSMLEEPPKICYDLPWLEHNRIDGKPFFCYETQVTNLTKYRAEFPMAIASLASIQDWDIVCWHSYGPGPDSSQLQAPNTRAIEAGHSLNLHYGADEVQLSAMRAAAAVFCGFHLPPAPHPTRFIFGRRMLLDPASMSYRGSYGEIGRSMLPTTYRYGVRLLIEPELETNPDHPIFHDANGNPDPDRYAQFLRQGYLVDGPVVNPNAFIPNPIRPHDAITYDWKYGYLRFDTPGVSQFAGFAAEIPSHRQEEIFTFCQSGLRLSNLKIVNPPDMPYPVRDDEQYLVFCLASTDGAPFATCQRAVLSLVSTSFNSGFELDLQSPITEFEGAQCRQPGSLPVKVARVAATIECPHLAGMTLRFFDFEFNLLEEKTIAHNGRFTIPASLPIFIAELLRQ